MSDNSSNQKLLFDFATLDLLPYGIIVVDQQGKILYYNAREEQIANRQRKDVIGKNFFREVAPCTQVQEFYSKFQALNNSDSVRFNFHFPFPERPRDVEIVLTGFEYNNELLCMITVADITEKEQVREQIMRAEQLRKLGETAAMVAHSFNNLLTPIVAFSSLLLAKPDLDKEKIRHYIELIAKAGNDGIEMVKRIQALTRHRQENNNIKLASEIDMNEMLQDSLALIQSYLEKMQKQRGITINISSSLNATLPVAGKSGELREVFINILRNAIDAIEQDGQITVNTETIGDYNQITIADNGTGMNETVLTKLFQPLFTTKGEEGTGLGLATCYAIVKSYNGDIKVQSELGAGSKFIISIPVKSTD